MNTNQEEDMPFPIEEKYIINAEKELGADFPADYRVAMMKSNGMEIEIKEFGLWTFFPIFNTADKKLIKRTANHILHENKQAHQWPNFPSDGLAIASDDCGNFLIFKRTANKIFDEIYDWDHETGETALISPSFSKLLLMAE